MKQYKSIICCIVLSLLVYHNNTMSSLILKNQRVYDFYNNHKHFDFEKMNTRKDVDIHMSTFIEDERVRQFLLKNLYWINKERLGLKLNINVLFEFKDKLSINLSQDLKFNKPSFFIYGDNSPYVDESDLTMLNLYFSDIEIIKVPFSGHWVHADNPSFFLEKTIKFLN